MCFLSNALPHYTGSLKRQTNTQNYKQEPLLFAGLICITLLLEMHHPLNKIVTCLTSIREKNSSKPFGKLWSNKVPEIHLESYVKRPCVFIQVNYLLAAPWNLIRISFFLNFTNQCVHWNVPPNKIMISAERLFMA